jgi:type I restriction enzyme S subunit
MKYRQIIWGECPKGWTEATLGDVTEKKNREYSKDEEETPIVCSINNKKGFTKSEEQFGKQVYSDELEGYSIVNSGEFAYNPSRINVGSIAQLREWESVLISPMYEVFSVDKSSVLPKYFRHLINSPQMFSLFNAYSEGSVRKTLNFTNFSEIPIILPPIPSQEHIVELLESIESFLENIENLVNLSSELKSTLFQDFISGKNSERELESRRLGPVKQTVPKNWTTQKLGEIADVKRGASPRPIDEYMGDSVNWIKISDISEGKYVNETQKHLIPEGKGESVFIESGTVILSISATVAEPAILNIDGCIHDGIVAFRDVDEAVLPEFLYYSLLEMRSRLESKGQRAAGNQSNINSTIVKNSKLVIPPLPEQKKIIKSLNEIDSWKASQLQKKQLYAEFERSAAKELVSGDTRKDV